MQKSNTSDMLFDVAHIISYLSEGTELPSGSVIITGTPEGVGYTRDPPVYLHHSDIVECEIEGIGVLRNRIVYE